MERLDLINLTHNHDVTSSHRPGGLWCLGTTGWLIGLMYQAISMVRWPKIANPNGASASARTLLAIDTAAASQDLTARIGPGYPQIRIAEGDFHIMTPRKISELAARATTHKATRRYGEKLSKLPDGSTDDGAGGLPLVATTNFYADLPTIDTMTRDRIIQQRDRSVLDQQHDVGRPVDPSKRGLQIIVGNWSGATATGVTLPLAQRIQHHCTLLGLPSDIVVIGTTPGVVRGGDVQMAKARYVLFCRQLTCAIEHPDRCVFHTFNGEELRLASGGTAPIVRAIPWGCATSRGLTVSDRWQTAADIALAANLMLDSRMGAVADGEFRDFESDRSDRRLGSRCWARVGASRVALDRVRAGTIAMAEGTAIVAHALMNGFSTIDPS